MKAWIRGTAVRAVELVTAAGRARRAEIAALRAEVAALKVAVTEEQNHHAAALYRAGIAAGERRAAEAELVRVKAVWEQQVQDLLKDRVEKQVAAQQQAATLHTARTELAQARATADEYHAAWLAEVQLNQQAVRAAAPTLADALPPSKGGWLHQSEPGMARYPDTETRAAEKEQSCDSAH